jgi:hypothetical protein
LRLRAIPTSSVLVRSVVLVQGVVPDLERRHLDPRVALCQGHDALHDTFDTGGVPGRDGDAEHGSSVLLVATDLGDGAAEVIHECSAEPLEVRAAVLEARRTRQTQVQQRYRVVNPLRAHAPTPRVR